MYGYAKVGDHTKVFGNARVIGEAIVSDEAVTLPLLWNLLLLVIRQGCHY